MRLEKLGALFLGLVILLAGCAGGNSSARGPQLPPLSDYKSASRAELAAGGELRLSVTKFPENFNPLRKRSAEEIADDKIDSFLAAAHNWIYAEDGVVRANPDYISSYTAPAPGQNDAPFVVKLNLNPQAKWNSGTPITAADYIASWKACSGQIAGITCSAAAGWKQISEMTAGENEFQVVISYKHNYADWPATFEKIAPAAGLSDADTFSAVWKDLPNVASLQTGPFRLSQVDREKKTIELVRNENWWGEAPVLEKVTFYELDEYDAAQAFAAGKLDALPMIKDLPSLEIVKSSPEAAVKISASRQWRELLFNTKSPLLQNRDFRLALQKGIDSKGFAASDLSGLPSADLDLHMGSHVLLPYQKGYIDNSPPVNGKLARKDLAELGYTWNEKTQYFEKDGEVLTLSYLRITGVPTSENEGQKLQEQLQKIGVALEMKDISAGEFQAALAAGEYDITSVTWLFTPYPLSGIGQLYASNRDAAGAADDAAANLNFTGYANSALDTYIWKIAREADELKKLVYAEELDNLLWKEGISIPLYYRANITGVHKRLANYGATALETFLPENIGFLPEK